MSLGFPDTSIVSLIKEQDVIESSDKVRVIKIRGSLSSADYHLWKADIASLRDTCLPGVSSEALAADRIIALLKEFSIESKTPVQCMFFLCELKKLITKSTLDAL